MEDGNEEDILGDIDVPDEQLENYIFNLVVSLWQQKSSRIGAESARIEVAEYLEKISSGMRDLNKKEK